MEWFNCFTCSIGCRSAVAAHTADGYLAGENRIPGRLFAATAALWKGGCKKAFERLCSSADEAPPPPRESVVALGRDLEKVGC